MLIAAAKIYAQSSEQLRRTKTLDGLQVVYCPDLHDV